MLFADWLRVKKNKLRRAGTHVLRAMKRRHPQIIVSMTSYPARINTVHLAIRSLLAQKVLPDKIVLWLCKSDFRIVKPICPKRCATCCGMMWKSVGWMRT